jgi:multidrug transporter EmrE-like cation transporter
VTSVSLAVGLGLICALLSALATNLAFLFKYKGAVAAPDVDMRHPLRSAVDLFRSKWWSVGWGVAAGAFALHVAALTLAPISIGQAVLAGGLVFLAVLAERFFGFELGRRQWIGIGLVAVSLALLTLTGGGGGEAHSSYSLAGMIVFEGIAVGVGVILVLSHLIERIPVQRGVLLGVAAGLGFGISVLRLRAQPPDRRRRRGDRRHLGRGEPLHHPRRAGGVRRPARQRRPRRRPARRGVRHDPRRRSADPSARSRRRRARGVGRGAREPHHESRPEPTFPSRTKSADRRPLAVMQSPLQ